MGVIFFCQCCGARFDVDARMAGKTGRCKKCGQKGTIPKAEQLVSMGSLPALAAITAGRMQAIPAAGDESIGSFLRHAASSIGLAPISMNRMPIGVRRGAASTPLDDAEDSKPYVLSGPDPNGPVRSRGAGAAGAAVRVWRRETGGVQKIFRKLNESIYLITIPFIMIFILGTALQNRSLALFGATFVVLLSVGRIAAGLANLAVVPLREGIHAGKKMKKPVRRVVEPVLTIVIVILAFTFIPWLSAGGDRGGGIAERLRSSAEELKEEMSGQVKKTVKDARHLDVDQLGTKVKEQFNSVRGGSGTPPAETPPAAEPNNQVQGAISDVAKRARETFDEANKQP
jgi:hypothetical protein